MPPASHRTVRVPVSDVRALVQRALGDQFTVERELGGGGMAHVFVAFDQQLERRVVVKVLPPELTATLSVERFRREILMAASMQHPHIVPVLSSGVAEELPYFIMPFVEGESLREAVRRGPMPIREVVNILRDVARALAFAHERGVVHRDIKPDNVLLTAGSATVTDFGVAKALVSARTPSRFHEDGTLTGQGPRSAPRPTWRPSRRRAIPPRTIAPTSTPRGSWRTRCSRASRRSRGSRRSRCWRRSWPRCPCRCRSGGATCPTRWRGS